jgi:hypothetical protein
MPRIILLNTLKEKPPDESGGLLLNETITLTDIKTLDHLAY